MCVLHSIRILFLCFYQCKSVSSVSSVFYSLFMQGKILVIDDEESIRFTFQRHLEREGHSVVTASDVLSAQETLSQQEFEGRMEK